MVNESDLTPMMRQVLQIKRMYPDSIVMTRMGDFYEMFFDDAKTASRELGITLTSRGGKHTAVPLAGVPYHAAEQYIAKLVKKGYKVTICEQLEDPKKAKGTVKRGVVRIITPGTVIENAMLDSRSNNYIASVCKIDNNYGLSLADISTGAFFTSQPGNLEKLVSELARFSPKECIIPLSLSKEGVLSDLKKNISLFINEYGDEHFIYDIAKEKLISHFKTQSLDGFGLSDLRLSVMASGALVSYLGETQMRSLEHINSIRAYSVEDYMAIDKATQRNLELVSNIRDGSPKGTLMECIDMTNTPMGARLIRHWILVPLIDEEKINSRLDAVSELCNKRIALENIQSNLSGCSDIERIISRISYGNANPRDLVSLRKTLEIIPEIKRIASSLKSQMLLEVSDINPMSEIASLVGRAIVDDPPVIVREAGIIKTGYNEELDSLHSIKRDSKTIIMQIEERERKRTSIKSLKVKFNKVFGYYIEITNSNRQPVPSDYMRKQTTANSERYITEELKELESKILGAEERINSLEYDLFISLMSEISKYTREIQDVSQKIAALDVLSSFAKASMINNYSRPSVDSGSVIEIKDGRHPVVEHALTDTSFVPNDILIGTDECSFYIITGPNMAGKSTYMRQVALITLLAQIGCFVPAKKARIGMVDRIFTRIGAHDDLSLGQSTFMIEMNETANILNNATSRSLVILDEIGRGTSTYDGLSIAWAVAEYILKDIGARTLFATHYHLMSRLSEIYPKCKNYHTAVKELGDEIVFLRKIVEGNTDRSYGIHVASLAGVPQKVLSRASDILLELESDTFLKESNAKEKNEKLAEKKAKPDKSGTYQRKLFY